MGLAIGGGTPTASLVSTTPFKDAVGVVVGVGTRLILKTALSTGSFLLSSLDSTTCWSEKETCVPGKDAWTKAQKS